METPQKSIASVTATCFRLFHEINKSISERSNDTTVASVKPSIVDCNGRFRVWCVIPGTCCATVVFMIVF